jgi:tRNA(Ile)-lysidine synthase
MDPVVVGGEEMPVAIVARPLLDTPKKDIIDFLTSLNLEWREDKSNASDKYLRNRVRNELIPLLSDIMGGADVLQVRL